MHCSCCDRLLTEFESTRRNANTFQFIDLCKVCFEDVKPFVPTIDRADLITEADLDEEPEDEYNLDTGDSTGLQDIIIDTIENYRDYDEHEEH
jgi:hypothetical protein